MRRPSSNGLSPASRRSLWVALALSLSLHALAYLMVTFVLRAPELEIAFELPMDVELGTSEALATPTSPPPQAEPPPAVGRPAATGDSLLDGGAPPSRDAAADDAGTDRDAATPARRRARDAGSASTALMLDGGTGEARMPPGAQIAVRVDMTRVRESPIAEDVRALLAAIPDWRALLDGSGIDPVTQLDRLLIATPNLQREKVVLAGSYLGGEQVVRDAVEKLAAAKGVTAGFRTQHGVRIAPWENPDPTPRVVALIGPRHFAIARAADLPRVLAIAAVRAQRKGSRARDLPHPADALLSMEEREGLSVEVEGAAQFVRGARRGIPERLRLSAVAEPNERIALHGVLTYDSPEASADASAYVTALRDRYAQNALVVLLGLAGALEDARITEGEREVRVDLTVSATQAHLILGYVRELLAPPRAP